MAKKAVIYSALVLALAIAIQGCYTMIQHPRVDYVDHANEYYTENCFSCHEDLGEYPYGSDYAAYPGYWRSYHNWGEYYSYPWWWESYWWDIQIKDNDDYNSYPAGGVDRRRGLLPGDAWQYILPPNEITNQNPPPGGDSGDGTATGTDDGGDTKTKDPNNQPEQKDPPKKPERRRLP